MNLMGNINIIINDYNYCIDYKGEDDDYVCSLRIIECIQMGR